MSPPPSAVTPMTSLSRKRPSNGGTHSSSAAAASTSKVRAQGSKCSTSEPKREVGKGGSAEPLVMEHMGPAVKLMQQPTSAPPGSVPGGLSSSKPMLDASGTTVATDKSSAENLVDLGLGTTTSSSAAEEAGATFFLGKLAIREPDTSTDESDCGPTLTCNDAAAADAADNDDLNRSRRRSPVPSLQCKSSFRSSPAQSPTLKKSVSFHQVHVQEYARTIGDHPDVVLGPPLTIDWEPQHHERHEFESYETARERTRKMSKIDMRVHPNTRSRMLLSAGVSREEIKDATRTANRIHGQRKSTVANLEVPVVGLVEEATQSAIRKIRRRSWRSGDAKKLGRPGSSGSLSVGSAVSS